MKTAISIPDDLFARAEDFARRKGLTRSALYAAAVDDYVRQHQKKDITAIINEIYEDESIRPDPVLEKLQYLSWPKEEW